MAACLWVGGQGAAVFHAIRARQDCGQGQALDRIRRAVAGQRGDVDHIAHAIGATVGRHERVDGRRGPAALDPAVGQVERRIGQRQERHILRVLIIADLRDQQRRGGCAGATHQTGIKGGKAVSARSHLTQHHVGPRHQRQGHARLRLCRAQRTG